MYCVKLDDSYQTDNVIMIHIINHILTRLSNEPITIRQPAIILTCLSSEIVPWVLFIGRFALSQALMPPSITATLANPFCIRDIAAIVAR